MLKRPSALPPQLDRYCLSRAKGETITDAARDAGYKRPHEAGSRAEKRPDVQARILALKRAAIALAAQEPEQAPEQVEQVIAQEDRQASALPVIADQAELLQHATHGVRLVGGHRKVKRSWIEYEPRKKPDGSEAMIPVEVEETIDGAKLRHELQQHYDAVADREAGTKTTTQVNVLVAMVQALPVPQAQAKYLDLISDDK